MSLNDWISLAATLNVPGLEFYSDCLDLRNPLKWEQYRRRTADYGMSIPMLCCSPDFTHPSSAYRTQQIEKEKYWIDMAATLGGSYCRVLSGQRRPEISKEDGIRYSVDAIIACHDYARNAGITLILENHYKDNYWEFPEFAQRMDVFCELVDQIRPDEYPNFGINYDPSNTLLAGEDALELLRRIKHRVVTMHASDRYLKYGTIDELRQQEAHEGYADQLAHGEIGQGVNDYDAIFSELEGVGFDGWISVEDGVDSFDQLERSVAFLRRKIDEHWKN